MIRDNQNLNQCLFVEDNKNFVGTRIMFLTKKWFATTKFEINQDKTISPKKDPKLVLGIQTYDEAEGMPDVEQIAELCARIHKLPTEWYEI